MSQIVIDGVKYKVWTPKDEEKQFHPMIKEHAKEIFGEDSLYFDVKQKIVSKTGIGSIPDGYVISFSKPFQWFIVEGELSSHPLYDHIVKQLNKFMSGIKNPDSQKEILDTLYDEITKNFTLEAYVRQMIEFKEIHRFLSDLIAKPPKVVVIIEEKSDEVKEACENLKIEPIIVEFKTFVRENAENVHAHLFEPIYAIEKISEERKKEEKVTGPRRPLPEHYESYVKMLAWVDENTRNIAEQLTDNIGYKLKDVLPLTSGRYLCFYKGEPSTKSIFAAFLLTKKYLKVRIRTDPRTLRDPNRLLKEKVYRGWFFKQGQEREFTMTNKDQIDYAMELIKHSYALAEK